MRKRRAASRVETPSLIAAITRLRRSQLKLLVIIASWQITKSSGVDNDRPLNPQADAAFIEADLEFHLGTRVNEAAFKSIISKVQEFYEDFNHLKFKNFLKKHHID